jgi:hypothetical protein
MRFDIAISGIPSRGERNEPDRPQKKNPARPALGRAGWKMRSKKIAVIAGLDPAIHPL